MRRNLYARDRECIARDSEPDDLEVTGSDGGRLPGIAFIC